MLEKLKSEQKNDSRTKICSRCKKEKLRSEFYVRRDRPSGVQAYCKECSNSGRWKNGRFRDEAHKQDVLAKNRASYHRHQKSRRRSYGIKKAQEKLRVLEAYGSSACIRCGFDQHPAALEFHH